MRQNAAAYQEHGSGADNGEPLHHEGCKPQNAASKVMFEAAYGIGHSQVQSCIVYFHDSCYQAIDANRHHNGNAGQYRDLRT